MTGDEVTVTRGDVILNGVEAGGEVGFIGGEVIMEAVVGATVVEAVPLKRV